MTQKSPGRAVAGLTLQQADILGTLYRNRRGYGTPYQHGEPERDWFRPVDLGGAAKSNHSHRPRNLVERGLVDSKPYGGGSYARIYRLSAVGIAAWERYAEHVGAGG